MSFLGDLLGAPNSSATLATSSTSSVVTIQAPAIARKKSGYFDIGATVATKGGNGITLQLVSSLTGNIGPSVAYPGVSAAGSVRWIDITSILVGQPVQYSVTVTGGAGSFTVAAGDASIVVDELGGPTPPQ